MSYLQKLADDCCLPLEDILAISKDDFYELSRNVVSNSVVSHARAYQEWKNAVEKNNCSGDVSSNNTGQPRNREDADDNDGHSNNQRKYRYVSPEHRDTSSVSCSSTSNYIDSEDDNAEKHQCKRKRTTSENFRRSQTEFLCAVCKKKFTSLKNFNKHVKQMHPSSEEANGLSASEVSADNKFKCNLCSKCFSTIRGLNIHKANCRKSSDLNNSSEGTEIAPSTELMSTNEKDPNELDIANLVLLEAEGRPKWITLLYFGIYGIKFNHILAFRSVMTSVLHYILYHGGKHDEGTSYIHLNNDWSSYSKEDQLAINHIIVACTMSDYGGTLTRTSNRLSMYVIKRLVVSIDAKNFRENFQLFPTRSNGRSRNETRMKDITFSSGEEAIREGVNLLVKTSDGNVEWNPYDIHNIDLDNILNFSDFKNWAKQTAQKESVDTSI